MTFRAFVAASALFGFAGAAFSSDADIDKYFNDLVAKGKAPSISVAIVKDGKVAYAQAFGYADLENDVAATPASVYRLGSITKQFTATMIMQLVQEKKLRLDQPTREILPDSPKTWAKVTVRNLLNHTSGIKSYTEIKGLFEDQAMKPVTPAGILKTVEKDPLDFPPGTQWHYDNSGYEVLGRIIEKLDGRKYAESLKARILSPLGMSSTYFTSERTLVKRRVQGYSPAAPGSFQHAPYLNMDWPYAAGSIESTVLDLAKWDAALYGDSILPQAALKQMWKKTVLTSGKTENYGFGWQIGLQSGVPTVEHGGGIHGFTTFFERVPSLGVSVIVLTNTDDGADPAAMGHDALGLFDSRLKVQHAAPITDADPAETQFARDLIQSIMDGKLDRTKLTPEFSKLVTPDMAQGAAAHFTSLGKIEEFVLVSSLKKDGLTTRSYRLKIGITEIAVTVVRDKAGLIAGLRFQ